MGYSLKDLGDAYKCIYNDKRWVGRVCKHVDGTYIGIIGKYITVRGCRTEKEAFNEAVAQDLRYSPYTGKRHHKPKKSAPTASRRQEPIIMTSVSEDFTATMAYMRPM